MPAPMVSGERPSFDAGAQAQLLEQLAVVAASQHRLEAALAHVSEKQAHVSEAVDSMAADLHSVIGKVDGVAAAGDKDFQRVTSSTEIRALNEMRAQSSSAWVNEVREFDHAGESDFVAVVPEHAEATSDAGVGLPAGWPSSVAVREKLAPRSEPKGVSKLTGDSGTTKFLDDPLKEEAGTARAKARRVYERIIIDPNGNVHLAFTLCSNAVLVYDLVLVPFMFAWDMPLAGFILLVSTAVASFWSLDVLVNFLSGYQDGSTVVMDPSRIAWHYVSTWFLPDMVVLASDWLSILLAFVIHVEDPSTESLSILRFTKLSRLIRVLAVFRMVKLAVILQKHMERTLTDSYRLIMKVAGFLFGTLWLAHLMACAFFLLGRSAPSNTGARWIDDVSRFGDRSVAFLDEDITYQYITSFHWTVAQITLGSMGINVSNTSERLFSIFMLLLGLLYGATMISSLSASMIDYLMLANDRTQKLRVLRRYLHENQVDHRVAMRVQKHATGRLMKHARLVSEDVHALNLLSASLRAELYFELYQRHIISHPLFRFWADRDATLARHFCSDCVSFAFLRPGDDVFLPGTVSDKLYLVVSGTLSYTQMPGSSPVTDPKTTHVGAGQWLSEAAMWSHWIHVGTLQAVTECQVLVVCVKELDSVLQRNRMLRDITREYCGHFHARITSAKPPHAPWPNDIAVPFTEYGDIVACMDFEVRTTIGLAALEHLAAWHRGFDKLQEEIQAGKSTITIDGNGAVERIVAIVMLHIVREDGCIWAQLGKQVRSDVACTCQLPGTKQQHHELVGDTAMRILERLGLSEQDAEIVDMERRVEWKESKRFDIRTKYLRTVCHARLRSESATSIIEAQRLGEWGPSESASSVQEKDRRTSLTRFSVPENPGSSWRFSRAVMSSERPSTFSAGVPRTSIGSLTSACSGPAFTNTPAGISDVFVRRHAGQARFFAWVTKQEYRQLQTATGEAFLDAWFAQRCLPPAEDEGGHGGDDEELDEELTAWV